MMTITGRILLLMGTIALAACSVVTAPAPVGSAPLKLEADPWQGLWLSSDGVAQTLILDAEGGVLQIGYVEASEGRLGFESHDVVLRTHGEAVFASIRSESDDEEEGEIYHWARIAQESGQLLVYVPDTERIAAAVKAGELPGVVDEDGDVALGPLDAKALDRLAGDATLYADAEPGALIRLRGSP